MKIVKKAGSMICESLCAHPKGSVGSPNKVAKRHSCLRSECFAYYKTVGVVFCSVACFNINCRWSVVRGKKKILFYVFSNFCFYSQCYDIRRKKKISSSKASFNSENIVFQNYTFNILTLK